MEIKATVGTGGTPLVSVLVPTYQHALFIEQCLDGILMQRTDFPVEILIGEDESTDGTREICQRYAAEHPDRIQLFLRSRKDVVHIMGKPTGRANLLDLMRRARGRYVALCEGDDHWIDPLKLQRQVDALEADAEATGCYTNAYNERAGEREPYHGGMYATPPSGQLDLAIYLHGQAIPTCTVLYRRDVGMHFMDHVQDFVTLDTPLFTYLLLHGHMIYQPLFTGVRTMHPGGVYSMQGDMHALRVALRNIAAQDALTGGRYHDILVERRRRNLRRRYNRAVRRGDWPMARLAWQHLRHDRAAMQWGHLRTWKEGLRVHYPRLYRLLFGSGDTGGDQTA